MTRLTHRRDGRSSMPAASARRTDSAPRSACGLAMTPLVQRYRSGRAEPRREWTPGDGASFLMHSEGRLKNRWDQANRGGRSRSVRYPARLSDRAVGVRGGPKARSAGRETPAKSVRGTKPGEQNMHGQSAGQPGVCSGGEAGEESSSAGCVSVQHEQSSGIRGWSRQGWHASSDVW